MHNGGAIYGLKLLRACLFHDCWVVSLNDVDVWYAIDHAAKPVFDIEHQFSHNISFFLSEVPQDMGVANIPLRCSTQYLVA